MVIYAVCSTVGGLPLFSRSTDTSDNQLKFSALSPLNAVQSYGKSNSAVFQCVRGKEFIIYWKTYHKSFNLILMGKNLITDDIEDVLDVIFNSLVMLVGLDEIINMKHDKLKREIRPSYPIIDRIMKCVDECKEGSYSSDLLSISETVISPDYNVFKEKLEEWSESICSLFCCLLLEDKVVAATSAWWDLSTDEKKLLTILVTSNNCCTSLDIPVFLLCKTPAVPFRLVSSCLVPGIWLCALCGPNPDLVQFEECCVMCWSSLTERLKSLFSVMPRNIPYSFDIHFEIIAFLLIDTNVGKYVLTGCLNSMKQNTSISEILRTFYYQNVKVLLKNNIETQKAVETYWSSDCYKLHGFLSNTDVLCIMYSCTVPNATIRSITKNTLKSIRNNKLFNW